ncbi:MAG TPA: hypothetical protein VE987_07265, partial [Polyangiaceae bacterium]|nr:hypothetical protein [Polyangiaceae bacterium]
ANRFVLMEAALDGTVAAMVRAALLAISTIVTTACAPPPAPAVATPSASAAGSGARAAPSADAAPADASPSVGLFDDHGDVGAVLHPGSVAYEPTSKSYTVAGSGQNMWFAADALHFVWKRVSGDVSLTADVSFLGEGGNEHRKAVLMVRQSLDADSVYADVARHGNGLTSLQYRDVRGGDTHEIQSNLSAPRRLRLERRGEVVSMRLAAGDEDVRVVGGSIRVPLGESFYVGIGVCAHDPNALERAVFTNVDLAAPPPPAGAGDEGALYSVLETVSIASTDRRVVYVSSDRLEAPNWTRDGESLLFNRNGRIERVPAGGGEPKVVDTGFAVACNNDHVLSPDGRWLAISDGSEEPRSSTIYVVPAGGGTPRRVTRNAPSYLHGWSPDGKTLVFAGRREDDFDVYAIPATGGREVRLTTAKGLDDGPEYSPDGRYIYFNSERTGTMQIWRMRPDGKEQEQVFSDEWNNWFPHVSPDGQWIVFLSYDKGVAGHPPDRDVTLRLLSLKDRSIRVIAKLFGGQGTINVPSWSPDSQRVAFVSYERGPLGACRSCR